MGTACIPIDSDIRILSPHQSCDQAYEVYGLVLRIGATICLADCVALRRRERDRLSGHRFVRCSRTRFGASQSIVNYLPCVSLATCLLALLNKTAPCLCG